jgi:hypothetical protein
LIRASCAASRGYGVADFLVELSLLKHYGNFLISLERVPGIFPDSGWHAYGYVQGEQEIDVDTAMNYQLQVRTGRFTKQVRVFSLACSLP